MPTSDDEPIRITFESVLRQSTARTVPEMKQHYERVELLKQYVRTAVENYMDYLDTVSKISVMLGKSDGIQEAILRMAHDETPISDAEIEALIDR